MEKELERKNHDQNFCHCRAINTGKILLVSTSSENIATGASDLEILEKYRTITNKEFKISEELPTS